MDSLKVNVLNLNKQVKGILLHSGYFFVSDVLVHKPNHYMSLQSDPALTEEQIEQLSRELARFEAMEAAFATEQPLDFSLQASSSYEKLAKRQNIFLMKELVDVRAVQAEDIEDNFLDLVFGLGEVTELCGLCATGKTQICFQLCLNVQVPKVFGGVEGHALYIDTHGDFQAERVTEMAKSLRAQVLKNIDRDPLLLKKYRDEYSIEKILSRIHYVRILDESEQILLHQMLEQVVQKFPQLKLLILDTFCEHLRSSEQGYGERKRTIALMLLGLQKVAAKYNLSVVLVNNMKTGKREYLSQHPGLQGRDGGEQGRPDFAPAKPEPLFGEDLFQSVTSRVMVERDQHSTEDNVIRSRLVKGSVATHFTMNPSAHFQITEKGIANII